MAVFHLKSEVCPFMTKIVFPQQFRGPPNSGNGGYMCGFLAREVVGPATSVLRARVPLDVELTIERQDGVTTLFDGDGALVARGAPAPGFQFPEVPPPPSLAVAQAAGRAGSGPQKLFHRGCFACDPAAAEDWGLRASAGQIEGAAPGYLATDWTPHEAFVDGTGLATVEAIWAALDCPGMFAWVQKEGRHGALLGTMSGEVLRRPKAGETCIVTAWPLTREGRKEFSGTALFSADGELLARTHHIWIILSQTHELSPRVASTT